MLQRALKMSGQRFRQTDGGEDVYRLKYIETSEADLKSSESMKFSVALIMQLSVSAAGSQFVLPQGTLTEDRTLASHHIYPSPASTDEGQFKFLHACVFVMFIKCLFNLIHFFIHIYFQMNGCVLSCGKTNMSWYTGACTLTGNARTHTHTHTHTDAHTQTEYLYIVCHFSTVMTVGCPQVMLKETLKSRHIRKSRGGLVQQHAYKK